MNTRIDQHPRIVVVGTSCRGKTTFSKRLAERLDRPHIELNALHWGPNWTPSPDFTCRVAEATAADVWIVDGNYTKVRDLAWRRASAMVWLNFSFPLVFWRSLARTCRRIASGDEIHNGNRESVVGAFFHWDGIPWWVVRTFHSRRRELHCAAATRVPSPTAARIAPSVGGGGTTSGYSRLRTQSAGAAREFLNRSSQRTQRREERRGEGLFCLLLCDLRVLLFQIPARRLIRQNSGSIGWPLWARKTGRSCGV